jgi:hypothetical protein
MSVSDKLNRIERAIALLKEARDQLSIAGAPRSAARVRACLKSAEGARRHAMRMSR